MKFTARHRQQVIRAVRLETGQGRRFVEVGERYLLTEPERHSVNIATLTNDPHFDDTDLHDQHDFNDLLNKDIEDGPGGRVQLDFYVSNADELISNVTLEWVAGELVKAEGTEKREMDLERVQ